VLFSRGFTRQVTSTFDALNSELAQRGYSCLALDNVYIDSFSTFFFVFELGTNTGQTDGLTDGLNA